ncbi:superoxide dismutase family protein [Phenylobacterium sp.]|uniref:superoxide dismutase family protein n=1 Tax=Phenylobacterium sp. TaxID=1871053 RepID=UPI003524540E
MRLIALSIAAILAAGAAVAADSPAAVTVDVKNAAGESLGQATISQAPNGVLARFQLKGLTPGWHGLHFHEKGDCSKADFTSAGGHVHDKATIVHGLLNPDANDSGDLPNLYAGADGTATAEVFTPYVTLSGSTGRSKLADADGSAIVVHAAPDDYRTQPIGGAGARIACGVIAPGA